MLSLIHHKYIGHETPKPNYCKLFKINGQKHLLSPFIKSSTGFCVARKTSKRIFFLSGSSAPGSNQFQSGITGNAIPSAPKFSWGFGVEAFHRFNKFEVGIEQQITIANKTGASDKIMQSFMFGGLNFKYHVNFTKESFYPLPGVGFAGAKTMFEKETDQQLWPALSLPVIQ